MSNWINIQNCDLEFTAIAVSVSKSFDGGGRVTIRAEFADVDDLIQSIGVQEVLNGIGAEAIREWLNEHDADGSDIAAEAMMEDADAYVAELERTSNGVS